MPFQKGHKINLGKKRSLETLKKMSISHKGQVPTRGMLGKRHTEKTKQKMSEVKKGQKHSEETIIKMKNSAKTGKEKKNWKGDYASYSALHKWIILWKGKLEKCEYCGKLANKINNRSNLDWANIDHTYKRNLDDYISLCKSCHKKYDIKYNNLNIDIFKHSHR